MMRNLYLGVVLPYLGWRVRFKKNWCQNPYSTFQNWYKTPLKVPCNEEPKIGVVNPLWGEWCTIKIFGSHIRIQQLKICRKRLWKHRVMMNPYLGVVTLLWGWKASYSENKTIFVFVRYELHLNVVYCIFYSTSKSFLFFNPYKIIKKLINLRLIAFN